MPSRTDKRDAIAGNLDTSFLKLLALLFMLIDHLGATLYQGVTEWRVIGRMALPLYAWCLVVGSVKTHSPLRYGIRLLVLAVLSQPLYMMALGHRWTDLNIIFLLLLAFLAIQGIRLRLLGSELWVPLLCYVALGFCKVDYGWRGLTFVLLLYAVRGTKRGLIFAYLAYALFWGTNSYAVNSLFGMVLSWESIPGIGQLLSGFFRIQSMVWLSLPLIVIQTNTGIRLSRRAGYALYPLHLVLLILLQLFTDSSWQTLLRGF